MRLVLFFILLKSNFCEAMMTSAPNAFFLLRQSVRPSKTTGVMLYSSSKPKLEKSYKLQGHGMGTKVEVTTNTGHALTTDIPKVMGGTDEAAQPVETLLASWMGCTQATALFVARHLPERASIQRIEFKNIEAFRDEQGALQLPIDEIPEIPSRLQRITGTIQVFSRTGLSSEQIELLKMQTEIRCPVANMMIASGCEIDVEWVCDASNDNAS